MPPMRAGAIGVFSVFVAAVATDAAAATAAAAAVAAAAAGTNATRAGDGCVMISNPSDNITDNTLRIQSALDDAPFVPGGGCVRVAGGDFVISGVVVHSNTTFRIDPDTRLVARINVTLNAVVHIQNAEHVTLEGGGTIHGSAEDAWVYFSDEDNRMQPFTGEGSQRPNVLLVSESRDIVVRDLHLHNSSDWTFRMDDSHDIFVDGVDIYGDERFPNNDGFDPESCTNVTLVNSHINVGDDGVCPKAGPAGPTAMVTVRNTTIRSKSGAIKLGSNTDNDMYDFVFDNITIWDSNGGLEIQQRSAGNIRNVTFSNIHLETRLQAPRWWGSGEWLGLTNSPRDDGNSVGVMSDIRFINITGRSENGGLVSGLTGLSPSSPFGASSLLFENISIVIDAWTNYSLPSSSGPPPQCLADPIICSNESTPHCSQTDGEPIIPGSAIRCAGAHDYRPHNGGNCSHYCRTPSLAHGIHFENTDNVTFSNVDFKFGKPWRNWFGACLSMDELSKNFVFRTNISCVNATALDARAAVDSGNRRA